MSELIYYKSQNKCPILLKERTDLKLTHFTLFRSLISLLLKLCPYISLHCVTAATEPHFKYCNNAMFSV